LEAYLFLKTRVKEASLELWDKLVEYISLISTYSRVMGITYEDEIGVTLKKTPARNEITNSKWSLRDLQTFWVLQKHHLYKNGRLSFEYGLKNNSFRFFAKSRIFFIYWSEKLFV
jgi:hypothetical protein